MFAEAYRGRRVLLTGHTGFKGGWLTAWLKALGADTFGYALAPDQPQGIFQAAGLESDCHHLIADVNDLARLKARVDEVKPDIIFHLAAQALVRRSYDAPLETLSTNVMGTAHVLEAVRHAGHKCAVVIVTSDKCYDNREIVWGFRETDAMGGKDVYSMSKGAAELVTASWRNSYFHPAKFSSHGVALASGRAGNVIGGGDWAADRIVPDCIAALKSAKPVPVRNPIAVRPWQHVLEPLSGYLHLGARLMGVGTSTPQAFCEGWNFGPQAEGARTVRELVEAAIASWGSGRWEDRHQPGDKHEATFLTLNVDKARTHLGWQPRWDFSTTVAKTVEWYRAQANGASGADLKALTLAHIRAYEAAA